MHNGKLSHLVEDVDEKSSARNYSSLISAIYIIENKMCHVNSNWKTFLTLETKDEISVLIFYSNSTKHMKRLKEENSWITNDNSFICMFLHNAIDMKSLEALSYTLITEHHIQPQAILKIMKKFISTSIASHEIRNKQSGVLNNKRSIMNARSNILCTKVHCFPWNIRNLIPNHIYSPLIEWFVFMSVNVENRNPAQIKAEFKFDWEHPAQKNGKTKDTVHKDL